MVGACLWSLSALAGVSPDGRSAAPPPATEARDPGAPAIELERYRLENGLDVVLAPDRSAPVVTVDVWYHVGSRDEEPGRTGFAHLFEHLMFQGTPSSPGEYFLPLERVGGRINGSTNRDRTNYHETVPAEQLPLALFLESDRMGWLLDSLDQARLDNQREVVRNERRQRVENVPYGDASFLLDEHLYPPDHGYRHPTIGSHEDLEAASLGDVEAFFRRWYAPDHAVLVVAGQFDPAVAKKLVAETFGEIRPSGGPASSPPPPTPPLRANAELRVYRDVPLRKVWLAWHSPAAGGADDAALDVLANVLAGGRDGRLVRALVERDRIAQDVTAFQRSSQWTSSFVVSATAAEGHTTDEVVAAVRAVLAETLRGDAAPTRAELDAFVAATERSAWEELETTFGRAETVQRCVFFTGDADCVAADLARYRDATPESVVAVGRRVLEAPAFALHVLPEADRPAPAPADPPPRRKKKSKK